MSLCIAYIRLFHVKDKNYYEMLINKNKFIESRFKIDAVLFNSIFIITGAVAIILYYFFIAKLPKHDVVWALGDEAGYLFNAAFASGFNWDSIADQPYYGFGYSMFLIPGFFICKTGADLIIFSHVVNMLFDILSFMLMYRLSNRLLPANWKKWALVISIVPVFAPHIVAQTLEVVCESCLFFFTVLSFYELYYLFEYNRLVNYILVAISTAYMFFVHTRSIGVIMGIWISIFFWNIFIYRDKANNMAISMALFAVAFFSLYLFKSTIVHYRNSFLAISDPTSEGVNNIITKAYILDRINWFLKEPKLAYFAVFLIKILYTLYGTGALLFVMVLEIVSSIKSKTVHSFEVVGITILSSWFITICLCTASGLGTNATYAYYGRYFEHIMLMITFWGLLTLYMYNLALKKRVLVISAFVVLAAAKFTSSWFIDRGFLKIEHVDNNRIASLGFFVERNKSAIAVTIYLSLLIIVMLLLLCTKNKKVKHIIPMIILISYLAHSQVAIKQLTSVSNGAHNDVLVADCVYENDLDRKIIFIDDHSHRYEGFYCRMQVLLKDYEITILEEDDIDDFIHECTDKYFLIYNTSPLKADLPASMEIVCEGSSFALVEVN